jgi:hypothetical protein
MVMLKKNALRVSIFDTIETNVDKAFGHLITVEGMDYKQLPEYKQFINNTFKFLDKLEVNDFTNIWKLVTNLVCDCLFFYTDAKKILLGIERAKELNPDVQIREALLLSTIEYVTDYICSQIKMTT